MKRIFTLFTFAFFLAFNANAQLADGSVAPDFTATDINGNEWNLYSLLDEGKTVIIDVSATWCPPCWSYHQGGTLETIWEDYGPDGTDEMFVFFIEGDASTSLADIQGTGGNTQGDWVTGTGYPIIDDASIASAYEITYFPTIYTVCPNRTVTESGQATVAAHYSNAGDCPAAAGSNNGAILEYEGLEGDFCGDATFAPKVVFQNLGTSPITTADLGLYLNGELQETVTVDNALNTFQTTEVAFDEITISETTELLISVDAVNGTDDDTDDYNEVGSTLNPTTDIAQTQTINVMVETDNYGGEVYWVIRDLDGIVYAEGGDPAVGASGGGQGVLGQQPGNNVVSWDEAVELPVDGCYEFAIYDDYGDGICCAYGNGSFSVTDDNDNVLAQGGEFTSAVLKPYQAAFSSSSVSAVEGLTALAVTPNPVSGLANVTFGLETATDISVTVFDVVGQRVEVINQAFTAGANQFTLDASNYANGVYFVSVSSKEGTSTVKFTVNK